MQSSDFKQGRKRMMFVNCSQLLTNLYCDMWRISAVSMCPSSVILAPLPDIGSQVCLVINWSFFQTFSIRYTKDSALERDRICIFVLDLLVLIREAN